MKFTGITLSIICDQRRFSICINSKLQCKIRISICRNNNAVAAFQHPRPRCCRITLRSYFNSVFISIRIILTSARRSQGIFRPIGIVHLKSCNTFYISISVKSKIPFLSKSILTQSHIGNGNLSRNIFLKCRSYLHCLTWHGKGIYVICCLGCINNFVSFPCNGQSLQLIARTCYNSKYNRLPCFCSLFVSSHCTIFRCIYLDNIGLCGRRIWILS